MLGIWVSKDTDLGFLAKSQEQVRFLSVLWKFCGKQAQESPAMKKRLGGLETEIKSCLY